MSYIPGSGGSYSPDNPTILIDDGSNVGVGKTALFNNTGLNSNTAIGTGALLSNTTGNFNVAIGGGAGYTGSNNSKCTFLGTAADVAAPGLTNACAIGANAMVDSSNTIVLGNGCAVQINNIDPINTLTSVITKWVNTKTSGGTTSEIILTLPITNGAAVMINANIVARNSGSGSGAYASSSVAVLKGFGAPTIIGPTSTITIPFITSTAFAVTATWSTTATDLVLTVTGILGSTIFWSASYEYFNL